MLEGVTYHLLVCDIRRFISSTVLFSGVKLNTEQVTGVELCYRYSFFRFEHDSLLLVVLERRNCHASTS